MRRWIWRIAGVGLLAGLAIWGWRVLFPGAEAVIRKQLYEMARTASFGPSEGPLAKVNNAQRLTSFFSPDLKINVDVPGQARHTFNGREELLRASMSARSGVDSLHVEFPGMVVRVGPDATTAVAELTARGRIGGGEEFVQELRLTLKKNGRQWLITRVETVKTLSKR
jgi:ketosteroid isomerase-like protein